MFVVAGNAVERRGGGENLTVLSQPDAVERSRLKIEIFNREREVKSFCTPNAMFDPNSELGH
jgi:hypothetical protein